MDSDELLRLCDMRHSSSTEEVEEGEEDKEEENRRAIMFRNGDRYLEGIRNTTQHQILIATPPEHGGLIYMPSSDESDVLNWNTDRPKRNSSVPSRKSIPNSYTSIPNCDSSTPNRNCSAPMRNCCTNSCDPMRNSRTPYNLTSNDSVTNNSSPRKTSKEKSTACLMCWFFALVLLLGAILVTVRMSTDKKEKCTAAKSDMCTSPECIMSADNLLQSMNSSADPCDDFYNYACGNWKQTHPMPDYSIKNTWATEGTMKILRKITEHLQEKATEGEPLPVTSARTFYNSCMDMEMRDSIGMEHLFQILDEVGLKRLPSLSLDDISIHNKSLHLIDILVKIKKRLGIDALLGFQVTSVRGSNGVDTILIGDPTTTTQQITDLGSNRYENYKSEDSVLSDDSILLQKLKDPSISGLTPDEVLEEHMLEFSNMCQKLAYIYDISLSEAKAGAIKIHLFQAKLDSIQNLTTKTNETTVPDLQKKQLYKIDIRKYISQMFDDIKNLKYNIKTDVIFADVDYIQALGKLLETEPTETVELYLWWKVVGTLITYTDAFMETVEDEFTKMSIGVEVTQARSIVCAKIVKNSMDKALSYLMATPKFIKDSEGKGIFSNIKNAFDSILDDSWVGYSYLAKAELKRKASHMKLHVGYPKWVLDKKALQKYYEGVQISETSFLKNVVTLMEFKMKKNLMRLSKGYNEDQFSGNPLDVNALYNPHRNTIRILCKPQPASAFGEPLSSYSSVTLTTFLTTVIAGYLQFPFYDLGMRALEYGTLGYTLGHELSHGFDNVGFMYDHQGRLKKLINKYAYDGQAERIKCFVKQFSDFEWDGEKVNGNLTLTENLADNGGIKTAFEAYRNLAMGLKEPKLPGLENFTKEQIFFLAYANSCCSTITKRARSLSLLFKHAPNYFRVIGSLMNSQEFSTAWKCRIDSPMNPSNKCELW